MAADRIYSAMAELYALSNGINLAGMIAVINGPLRQEYKKGTDVCTPDWTNSANKPLLFAKLNRTDNGKLIVPINVDLYYNGVLIAFGPDGISTTGAMAGMFKKAVRSVNVDGADYPNMPTFEILKNLVPISSFDNDTIMLKGSAEIEGFNIGFDSLSRTVEIIETVGQSTMLYLDGDTDITNSSPEATINAHVLIDGTPPTDMSAYVLKWYDVAGATKTLIATGVTSLKVLAKDVDGNKTILCELYKKGGTEVLASSFIPITDFTDPGRVALDVEGIEGKQIRNGQTAVYTAVVLKSDGTEIVDAVTDFTTTDKNGNIIGELSGRKKSISVEYNFIVSKGKYFHFYAKGSVTV